MQTEQDTPLNILCYIKILYGVSQSFINKYKSCSTEGIEFLSLTKIFQLLFLCKQMFKFFKISNLEYFI